MNMTRRSAIVGLASGAISIGAARAADPLKPTPQETFGPFYPVNQPMLDDIDMTKVPGRTGRALGQVIELSGRVLRTDGSPVKGAAIEIWQANAAGRYVHPIDKNPAALDPNFHGITVLRTDDDGRYRVMTVRPGAYPGPGGMRTPHIHFNVASHDYRLVVQMYFPGEPLNDKDILLSTMASRYRDPAAVICRSVASSEPSIQKFDWDMVLLQA